MTSKKRSQAKSTVTLSFHFTVLPVENGYRLQVSSGEQEYMWPDLYTIDLEGRIVKDGVKKALRDRQLALAELVHAIQEHRKIADSKPLTLQGSDYAHSAHELNKAIDRAEGLLQ